MTGDPFGTAEVRERVLAAWSASPVRFREDANAEEDFALGGYRDRVVVELAQNAADAATRARVPGRLLLAVRELQGRAVLVAANTGAPLDADGVLALATLRASAKRDEDAVGRFGVGFSAVLSVSDEPAVLSRAGGVRFSAADTRALVDQAAASSSPGLAQELARRDGHVPVLRLPFPAEGVPPVGYDTAVLLPLRDAAAEDVVLRGLAEVADPLLLALPGLAEVTVEVPGQPPRTVAGVHERWHVLRRSGVLDPGLLADRPTEERARRTWSVTWALPRDAALHLGAGVVHAPTPSQEPLPWPAVLVASLPLDSSRRHVAPGPAADAVLAAAAQAYADLLADRAAAGDEAWRLVPGGLAAGAVDGALRAALGAVLPDTPLLPSAEDPALLLRPRDAVALEPPAGSDPATVAALAPAVAALVLAPRAAGEAFDRLGVRRLPLAEVVDQLAPPTTPQAWAALYEAFAGLAADPLAREALAGLPVPLADGRVVRGARGVVLPGGPVPVAAALAALGARAVDPGAVGGQAARTLLERLGARDVGARAALDLPQVRAAAEDLARSGGEELRLRPGPAGAREDVEPDGGPDGGPDVVTAVLTLVAAALDAGELPPGGPDPDLPWLAGLALRDADGDPAAAGDLALPGSTAAAVLDPEVVGPVAPELLQAWGPDVLRAVGVLDGLATVRARELPLDPDGHEGPGDDLPEAVLDLDGLDEWLDELGRRAGEIDAVGAAVVTDLVAVRDLDAVREEGWPAVLDLLGTDPDLRAAVLAPARVVVPVERGRTVVDGPSYTAWWLRRRLAGGTAWADPAATLGDRDRAALLAVLPGPPPLLAGLEPALRAALGAVATPADLDARAAAAVLARLADDTVALDAAGALAVWAALARSADDAHDVAPPRRVRVLDGGGTRVVEAGTAVVVDTPALLQRPDLGAVVLVDGPAAAAALADLLDLPLASELAPGRVAEDGADAGEQVAVPAAVRALLPGAPRQWCEHEQLVVDGVEVDWWVSGSGPEATVHASTLDGLARGLAWSAGAWWRRSAVAEVLADPDALAPLLADEAFAPAAVSAGSGPAG